MPKAASAENTIDFSQPLRGLDGAVLTEKNAAGEPEPVLLYTVCTAILVTPRATDQAMTAVAAARIFKLALMIANGGTHALTVDQRSALIDRVNTSSYGPALKALVLRAVDPVAFEKA